MSKLSSVKVRNNRSLNGQFDWREEVILPVWLWVIISFISWWFRHRVVAAVVLVALLSVFTLGYDPMVLWNMLIMFIVAIVAIYSWVWSRYDYSPSFKRVTIAIYRRQLVRRRWAAALKAAGFKRTPKLRSIHYSPNGINAKVRTTEGQNSTELAAGSLSVAGVLKAQDFRVDDTLPFEAKVSIIWGDPTEQIIFPEDLMDSHADGGTSRIAFGVDNDHMPVKIATDTSVLIVGESGSGKSNALWSIINGYNEKAIPYELWVADPAGGVELSYLKGSPNVVDYRVDPNDIRQMFERMYKSMQDRLEVMEKRGLRKVEPSEEFPLQIAVVDEWLLIDEQDTRGPAGKILSSGRKAGYIFIALSQLAQKTELAGIRDLFPQRLCHATKSKGMTDAALGEGAEAAGARCSKISKSTPGVGYYYSLENRIYTRFRTPKIDDDAASIIAMGDVVRIRKKNRQVSRKRKLKKLLQMPTAVYQLYNFEGRLLYVGISNNVDRRFHQHSESKEWWKDVDHDLTEVNWYPKRKLAMEREKELIQTQLPLHNKQHSVLDRV